MTALLEPPLIAPTDLAPLLATRGYAVVDIGALAGVKESALAALGPSWEALPEDAHLKDVGRYRRRRHASFVVEGAEVTRVAHRAHWQPVEYNALHGGMLRWFEPVDDDVAQAPSFLAVLRALAQTASALRGARDRWYVEAHQFRIEPGDGIGRPTPEGAHRDGVDVVAVVLVGRRGIKGGETRVFEADGPTGVRFTLTKPWTALILDDARVIHETTPILRDGDVADGARDTLVITVRADGFQGP